jgi:hypothetical protein
VIGVRVQVPPFPIKVKYKIKVQEEFFLNLEILNFIKNYLFILSKIFLLKINKYDKRLLEVNQLLIINQK